MSVPRVLKASEAPFSSFTSLWHQDSYPSISPSRPELSANGKNIFITGAGTGIGGRVVLSFAEAGAANIGILGRRTSVLEAKKEEVLARFPKIKVHTFAASVTEHAEVEEALSDFAKMVGGQIHVLVNNAAIAKPYAKIEDIEFSQWKEVINTNTFGSFIVTQCFLRYAAPGAVLINVSSCASFLLFGPGISAYAVSKASTVALYRYLQFERPDLRCVSVQPGAVSTELSKKTGPMVDDAALPGDFCVWLSSPEAAFTAGKYLFVNWDVDELKARADEISSSTLLEMWPDGLDHNPALERL